MTAKEMVNELARLSLEAGKNVYLRAKLATELLADRTWVEEEFRGNDFDASDHLEETYFSDLSGAYALADLVGLYQALPDDKEWAKKNYNLRKLMQAVYTPEKREPYQRATWKQVRELEKQLTELKVESTALAKERDGLRRELAQATHRLGRLEAQNDELRGEVHKLVDAVNRTKKSKKARV